jgi:hypothetical protein
MKSRKLLAPARLVSPAMPWRVVEHARNVHALRFDNIREGWEQYVLLQSDEHFDNPHCNRDLYKRHLDLALARRAPVIKYGDLFCAMQGKFDKRAAKSSIRAEDNSDNYLDRLVENCARWHAPYASILALAGPGNHETSILKHHETHLTERFVEQVRAAAPSSPLRLGGFSGWVRFMFNMHGTSRQSMRLWYHHGYGGGGPVTRGVIQTNRRAVYVDADMLCTGHIHDEYIVPIQRIRLNDMNAVEQFRQLHLCTPGYKDEYDDGYGGWHIERGGPPKPIGAIWLRFWFRGKRVHVEALSAQ